MVLRQTSCGMAAPVAAKVGRALRASRKVGRLAEDGSPHPCTPLARHWLRLWNVRSSFAGAPLRAPRESYCFAHGLALPKMLAVTGKGRESFVKITHLSPRHWLRL